MTNRHTVLRERRGEKAVAVVTGEAAELLQQTQRGAELIYKLEDTLCLLKQHIRLQNRRVRSLVGSKCMEPDE